MRNYVVAGSTLVILGITMVFAGTLLAYIKMEAQLVLRGPEIKFNLERRYWIEDHIIPPIEYGTPIELKVLATGEGGPIYVFLYPLSWMIPPLGKKGGGPITSGVVNETHREFVFSGHAPISDQYIIELIVYNNTYTVNLHSVFPPLYSLRVATMPGLLFTPGGLAIIYYDRIRRRKEEMFQEALGKGGNKEGFQRFSITQRLRIRKTSGEEADT